MCEPELLSSNDMNSVTDLYRLCEQSVDKIKKKKSIPNLRSCIFDRETRNFSQSCISAPLNRTSNPGLICEIIMELSLSLSLSAFLFLHLPLSLFEARSFRTRAIALLIWIPGSPTGEPASIRRSGLFVSAVGNRTGQESEIDARRKTTFISFTVPGDFVSRKFVTCLAAAAVAVASSRINFHRRRFGGVCTYTRTNSTGLAPR